MAASSPPAATAGARAAARDVQVSVKHGVEVCRWIRGKPLPAAKKLLEQVIKRQRAVPYLRYNWDLGHKRGMAAGRYPVRTCQTILRLLQSAEVNAQFKGMNTSKLAITHIVAHRASRPLHAGRHRGRVMKRAHLEVVVQERVPETKREKLPHTPAPPMGSPPRAAPGGDAR